MEISAIDRLREKIISGCQNAEFEIAMHLVLSLSNPGSVRPFIVAPPGEPSYNWDNELTGGISGSTEDRGETVVITLISAGVSLYQHPGRVIAADAEYGSWWDGWAYDSRGGKWVKIAPPHEVAPRPHMAPAKEWAAEHAMDLIAARAAI